MILYLIKKFQVYIVGLFFILLSALTISSGIKGLGEDQIVGGIVSHVVAPVQSTITHITDFFGNIWSDYIYLVESEKENILLKKEIDKLTRLNNELKEKASFGERVKGYLDFKENSKLKLTAVRIVGLDTSSLHYSATVDKGNDNGIKKNMPVITPKGIVGRVIKVYPHSSQALFIVDPNSTVDALIQRSRIRGIVEGRGDNTLAMKYVPIDADVLIGDYVMSSGLSGVFPKGLAIGRITKIDNGKDGFFKIIELKPIVTLQKLEELLIVTER